MKKTSKYIQQKTERKEKVKNAQNVLENLSQEELKSKIEDEKKNARRSILLSATALIAMIAIALAWFINNVQVKTEGINVMAQNDIKFELATTGENEVVDTRKNLLNNFLETVGGLIGESYTFPDEKTGIVTSAANSTIQWNMSEGYDFANVVGSGMIDGTGDENIGLQPGTSGKLEFYIIPKVDGEQTINFTISLIPYVEAAKRSGLAEVDSNALTFTQGENGQKKTVYRITDSRVNKVLNGHIYFFQEKNDELYTSWLEPDENGFLRFSVKLDQKTVKDTPYVVTFYWDWPTLLSQVLLAEGDGYLAGREQLFNEETQAKIVSYIEKNPSSFFLSAENKETSVEDGLIQNIHEASWNGNMTEEIGKKYLEINQLYNNADQFLGKTVSYVVLELNATN